MPPVQGPALTLTLIVPPNTILGVRKWSEVLRNRSQKAKSRWTSELLLFSYPLLLFLLKRQVTETRFFSSSRGSFIENLNSSHHLFCIEAGLLCLIISYMTFILEGSCLTFERDSIATQRDQKEYEQTRHSWVSPFHLLPLSHTLFV
jgi:hypothetical protein